MIQDTRLVARSSPREIPISPWRAALPELALAAAAAGVGLVWRWAFVGVGTLLVTALARGIQVSIARERRRRAADEWLLRGSSSRPPSALLVWRVDELTSQKLRSTLARSLHRLERQARGATLPGPVPLNTRAIRCHLALIRTVRDRLDDPAQPVDVRGVILVDRLLTEPGSPLYSRVPGDVLAAALSEALVALDPFFLAAAA